MSKASAALADLPSQSKPHINLLPKDPLEARFCQIFSHPWDWIKGEGKRLYTMTKYPLQPRDLIRYWKDPLVEVGVSFGPNTTYALLDIDAGGKYHPSTNPAALDAIKACLEEVGITRSLDVQSSDSTGMWLMLPLPESVSSFRLAQVLHSAFGKAGFDICPGQLEVFPNLKHWNAAYHAHRLPLQAGSYLLDSDLQPVSNNLEDFLRAWDSAAAGQDMELLKRAMGSCQNVKPLPGESERARAFREDLEARINEGWTGDAQTNALLLDIGRLCRIFYRLGGDLLVKKILEVAQSLPGYQRYCDHQHDIARRAKDVARWAERYYQPIGFRQAITEPLAPKGPNNHDKARNAQERIKAAVAALEAGSEPPTTITGWRDAIAQQGISPHTLYKYKYLWHPEHRLRTVSAPIQLKQEEALSPEAQLANACLESPKPKKTELSIDPLSKKRMCPKDASSLCLLDPCVGSSSFFKLKLLSEDPVSLQGQDLASKILRVRELLLEESSTPKLVAQVQNPVHLKQILLLKDYQEQGQTGLPNPDELEVTSSQLEAAGLPGYSGPPDHAWIFRRKEISPRIWKRLRQVVFGPWLEQVPPT